MSIAMPTHLVEEWHPTLNGNLKPTDVSAGSNRVYVWWLGKCGHEWRTKPSSRARAGTGCPICNGKQILAGFNDLAHLEPKLAAEWHPTKNSGVTAQQVTSRTIKPYWWLGSCGHEWIAPIANRVRLGNGCPYCSGRFPIIGKTDLASVSPEVASEWHPTKNKDLLPTDVTAASHRKVWWQPSCMHEWFAPISSRRRQRGCPICSGTLVVPGVNDLAHNFPALAEEWDYSKNELSPENFTSGSDKKVWWL